MKTMKRMTHTREATQTRHRLEMMGDDRDKVHVIGEQGDGCKDVSRGRVGVHHDGTREREDAASQY